MSWSGKSRRTKGELGENRHDLGGWPALHLRPLLLLLLHLPRHLLLHLPHPRSVVPPVTNASALSEQELPRNWWPTLPGSKPPNRPPRHPLANLWPAAGHPLATPPGNKPPNRPARHSLANPPPQGVSQGGVTGRARQQREECPTQLRGAGRARGDAPLKGRWAPRSLGGPQWPPVAPSGPPPPIRGDTVTEGLAITRISK